MLAGLVVLWEHPHRAFPSLLVATFCCEIRVEKQGGSRLKFFKVDSDK